VLNGDGGLEKWVHDLSPKKKKKEKKKKEKKRKE
jgi:hypothetical protein